MFESVELWEFMGVRRCREPVGLGRFTVLVGPNDSGKTTLLVALFLAPFPWTTVGLPLLDVSKSYFLGGFLGREAESLVYRYSGGFRVAYRLDGRGFILEGRAGGREPVVVLPDGREATGESFGVLFDYLGLGSEEPRGAAGYSLMVPNSSEFLRVLEEKLAAHWQVVEKTGAHFRLVRDYVVAAVGERLTEVGVRFGDLAVRKELPSGEPYWVRLRHLGSGVWRFLVSALWLEAASPRVVLWDDFEVSAHPALVGSALRWLASRGWQVVLSTHSLDVLWELAQLDVDDAVVLSLRRMEDDTLVYTRYSLDELRDMFDSGVDVRRLLAPG